MGCVGAAQAVEAGRCALASGRGQGPRSSQSRQRVRLGWHHALSSILLLGLLAVRLVDDEREQARCRRQDVTNVGPVGPPTLIPGPLGQENPLSRMSEAVGFLQAAMVTSPCNVAGGVDPSCWRCGKVSFPSNSRSVPGAKRVLPLGALLSGGYRRG